MSDNTTDVTDRQDAQGTRAYERHDLEDDNPFAEVVRDLREDGETWAEVFNKLDNVYAAVDSAAYEEGWYYVKEWECRVVLPDSTSTSGESYGTVKRVAETEQDAIEKAKDDPEVIRVSDAEHTGYCRLG